MAKSKISIPIRAIVAVVFWPFDFRYRTSFSENILRRFEFGRRRGEKFAPDARQTTSSTP